MSCYSRLFMRTQSKLKILHLLSQRPDSTGSGIYIQAMLREAQVNGGQASTVLERGKLRMDSERHSCTWDGSPVTLTVTEFLILEALAQRPGVVKSRDALMDAAYDDQVYVDDRTIDSHIKRLRKKFRDIDDSFQQIETLYGVGYRYREA